MNTVDREATIYVTEHWRHFWVTVYKEQTVTSR